MDFLFDPNLWIAFAMLTALEIVLGIDNIIFISILVGRLPPQLRDKARRLGLGFAMLSRLALLFSLSWVMGLTDDLFNVVGEGISGRDLVLLFGGLFLLYKASHEIFVEVEAHEQHGPPPADAAEVKAAGMKLFWGIIGQIAIIDIVFSLDSVITAVGMVDHIGVMVAAIVTSVAVMLVAAKPIGDFVDRHPSVKVLALAFLVMVGMALTAEAFDAAVPKGYIYAAMAFSLAVEALNIRARAETARGVGSPLSAAPPWKSPASPPSRCSASSVQGALVQWGLMPQRVIALLLALVLFWSGFTTQEQAISFASSNIVQADSVPGDLRQPAHDGSIDDHHLDDQPGQTPAEGAMELLPLLMTRPTAGVPTLTMSWPRPYAMAAWLEPYLAGPQRPPCATHLVA